MKKIIQLSSFLFLTLIFCQCDTEDNLIIDESLEKVTDLDGNVYNTLRIGNQTWMAENLKTTTLNNSTNIAEYTFGENWNKDNQTFPFYQWADTSDLNNNFEEELPFDYYGALYNEATISSGNLAPEGWRIPTEADFIELKNYLSNNGHTDNEGTVLKSTVGWNSFNGNGTDLFGFNALPNGYNTHFGTATGAGAVSTLATADHNTADKTRRVLNLLENTMEFGNNSSLLGAGIRCIKN